MFESIQDRSSSPILKWTPSFAGLLAALWVASIACPTPPKEEFLWGNLPGVAVKYAALTCLTTACIGWCSAAFIPSESRREARRLVFRTAAAALWLAPFAIFLSERSMWAVPVMGCFVATLSAALRADAAAQRTEEAPDPNEAPATGFLIAALPRPQPARRAAVVAVAAFGQSALVAALVGVSLAASLFLGLTVALITWVVPAYLGRERSAQRRWGLLWTRPVPSMVVAMLLVLVGLLPYLRTGEGPGDWLAFLWNGEGSGGAEAEPEAKPETTKSEGRFASAPDEMDDSLNDSFPGVILWPESKPHVTLITPRSPTYGRLTLDESKPFSVPFDGVYWFLRADFRTPPDGAFVTRGTPVERTFRTTARSVPLAMLARHNFGGLIDVSCCGRIHVEITNADVDPRTVALKLTLVNTTLPGEPSQFLGAAPVTSTPRLLRNNEIIPARETLMFFIPDTTPLRAFNEVEISFQRDWRRRDQSVKIGIDRFVLLPKGQSSTRRLFGPVA